MTNLELTIKFYAARVAEDERLGSNDDFTVYNREALAALQEKAGYQKNIENVANERDVLKVENMQMRWVITETDPDFFTRKCRGCGCDWNHPCPGGCFWVEDDLCSRCAERLNEMNAHAVEEGADPHETDEDDSGEEDENA